MKKESLKMQRDQRITMQAANWYYTQRNLGLTHREALEQTIKLTLALDRSLLGTPEKLVEPRRTEDKRKRLAR